MKKKQKNTVIKRKKRMKWKEIEIINQEMRTHTEIKKINKKNRRKQHRKIKERKKIYITQTRKTKTKQTKEERKGVESHRENKLE